MSTEILQTKDSFSWHRVMQLGNFYRPMILRQTLVYFAISVLSGILMLLPTNQVAQIGIFSIIWTALPFMMMLAPTALCKSGDSRIIERMIPAKPAEKFVFLMLYFLVVIPATVYIVPEAAIRLYTHIDSIQTSGMLDLLEMRLNNPINVRLLNIDSSIAVTMTCLCVVYSARHNRLLKSVIAVFAVEIAIAIMGMIWGIKEAFNAGFEDGMNCRIKDPDAYVESLAQDMSNSYYIEIVGLVLLAYSIYMMIRIYRVNTKRNM